MATGRILLTGATGFVGSHVAERLTAQGLDYICAIRPERTHLSWVAPLSPACVRVDLSDPGKLAGSLKGIETVVHVAGVTKAKNEQAYIDGNVTTTAALIEASRNAGVRRFCYVSSLTAVGPNPDGVAVRENAVCHPITAYGRSKLDAETRVLAARRDLEVVILRPPAVYGPRDKDILGFFQWASLGLKPVLGGTNPHISIIHVHDLAEAIVHCALHPSTAGEVFVVSDPIEYRYDDVFRYLGSAAHRKLRPVHIPEPILRIAALGAELLSPVLRRPLPLNREKLTDLLQPYWTCCPDKLSYRTGFRTRIDGESGFHSTFGWYKARGWIS